MKNNICPCCLHRDARNVSFCVRCGAKLHPALAKVNFAIELSYILAKAAWGVLFILFFVSMYRGCTSHQEKSPREEEADNLEYALFSCYSQKDYDMAYKFAARLKNSKVRAKVEQLIGIQRLGNRWEKERRKMLNNEEF